MNISEREKNVLITGGVFLILFIAAQFFLLPAVEKKKTLAKMVLSRKSQLNEIYTLQNEYKQLTRVNTDENRLLSGRAKNFTLFAFLDTLAEKSGVKKNIAYMKPSSVKLEKSSNTLSTVRVKLESLFLNDLVDFLYRIESSTNAVNIKSLSLSKTGKEKKMIDAVIEVQTLIIGSSV